MRKEMNMKRIISLCLSILLIASLFGFGQLSSVAYGAGTSKEKKDNWIIDFSTGLLKKDLKEIAEILDTRLAYFETDMGAGFTESNAKQSGQSNNIIAIARVEGYKLSKERAAVVYGYDSEGNRTDGIDNLDITRLKAVIYTDNMVEAWAVTLCIMAMFEDVDNDEIQDIMIDSYKSVAIDENESYEYVLNGICYVMTKDAAGNLNFEAYASTD